MLIILQLSKLLRSDFISFIKSSDLELGITSINAIPIPGTFLLMVIGLVALFWAYRKMG